MPSFRSALNVMVKLSGLAMVVYRTFGFPGADDLGNMFQYKRDFETQFCAARDVAFSKSINPKLQNFTEWVKANKDRIAVG